MPKCIHHTFEGGGIAIWHITESADVLYDMLDTHRYDVALETIHHETRRKEWLAVRVLIAHVLGPDKEVAYYPTGKPYLVDGSFRVSISHTKEYAAIAYHQTCEVGVDIERISSRVERIADRFSHASEIAYIDGCDAQERILRLLVNWSAKETLYKCVNTSSAADFKNTFHIEPYEMAQQGRLIVAHMPYDVNFRLFPDFVCTWAIGEQAETMQYL